MGYPVVFKVFDPLRLEPKKYILKLTALAYTKTGA